jgi:hypothetical protein
VAFEPRQHIFNLRFTAEEQVRFILLKWPQPRIR